MRRKGKKEDNCGACLHWKPGDSWQTNFGSNSTFVLAKGICACTGKEQWNCHYNCGGFEKDYSR